MLIKYMDRLEMNEYKRENSLPHTQPPPLNDVVVESPETYTRRCIYTRTLFLQDLSCSTKTVSVSLVLLFYGYLFTSAQAWPFLEVLF